MKNPRILIIIIASLFFTSKINSQVVEITYQSFQNGIENKEEASTIELNDKLAYLSSEDARIRTFIDYQRKLVAKIIRYEDRLFRMDTPFDSLTRGVLTEQKDTILGIECQHMVYDYFSNKVEVYYSEKTTGRGSPYSNFLPSDKALVLKVVINGNRELVASKMDTLKRNNTRSYPFGESKPISAAEFEELRIKSRYTSLSVFKNQIINFDPSIPRPDWTDSHNKVLRVSNGTIVLKKIQLPDIVKNGAYTFINLQCRSNGDAYDRTGSVFMLRPGKNLSMLNAIKDSIQILPYFEDRSGRKYRGFALTESFTPATELMRFFTSFGVDHFNDKRVIHNFPWELSANYEQEVSDLIPTDVDEIWLGVFIGNYSKGGHLIDLDLEFYPSFENKAKNNRWIQPLFNTVNIMEMSGQEYPRLFKTDTLNVKFTVPDSIQDLKLLYTSTGHGGWGGGDEFNPRLNKILLDDQPLFKVVPWRTDCATYRLYNPASGNFDNGMSSSDFSRSNWCPATSTPPYLIPLTGIAPGTHEISVIIDQGDDEGSSFNAWGVSGILVGNRARE
jgi:hypothetical protein